MTDLRPGWAESDLGSLLASLPDGRLNPSRLEPSVREGGASVRSRVGCPQARLLIRLEPIEPEHNKRLPDHLDPRELLAGLPGDLLITSAGPRARCGDKPASFASTPRRLMISGKMYRFRVDPRFVDARYIEAYLLSIAAQRAIEAMKTGISDSGLNLTHKRFAALRVPLAPLAEQRRIVAAIENQLSRLDAADAGLRRLASRLALLERAVVERAFSADGRDNRSALWRRSWVA